MFEKAYNDVVHHLVAHDHSEVDQIFAYLPRVVANGLVRTLDEAGEAYRYDAEAQRAYFFRREGTTTNVWSWNNVRSAQEFGDLVALIARLDLPFDDEQANKVYLGATGRGASQPFPGPHDDEPDR